MLKTYSKLDTVMYTTNKPKGKIKIGVLLKINFLFQF